jgi:hypothetical protein
MPTSGYSGTPLLKKLGLKERMKVQLLHAPDNYFALLENNIQNQLCKKNEPPDFVHLFVKNNFEFETAMYELYPLYKKNTSLIIWVSWYKKASGIATDITEDIIRSYALGHGLVDIKVCAVSDLWSGLKLVVPLAKRTK